ncbi:hypothetical protein GCM10022223_54190 [Kineosporia mesophila]|uniref:CheW-like domain-containing protein n=1 Tax=Kineosporia mesophila TaxID=566012 RepID=A0ABP7AD54_9ACTN|nr:chemotaxis protein CheW [Kineosporia mesophila]MCD5355250.1 chemotaxis protein CheW [Kineosporia mesophila]
MMNSNYGLFAIGEACVALPLSAIREVTPCPDPLAALPTSAPGLLGAVNLRGQVIPVLTLDETTAPDLGEHRVVVVMAHQEKLLGLLVDSVHGVTAPSSLQVVGSSQSRLPVSHTFPAPDGGGIVSVLDVERVFGLPGILTVHDDRSGQDGAFGHPADEEVSPAATGSLLLVRCADHRLALNIEVVHTIVPRVSVRNSPLKHGSCRGVTDFDGVEIPVFDPLELTGLGRLPDHDTEGVAVRFREGVVVMLLSEVLELIPASTAQRLTLPAVQVPGRRYLDAVLRVPGLGDFLGLAVDEILQHEDLNALSRLNTPLSGSVPGQPEAEWGNQAGGTYLTFSVGPQVKDFAVPLDQVIEILPFPQQYSVLESGDENVLGLFTHRDAVVPMYRLSGLIAPGRGGAGNPEYVLVVSTGPGDGVVGMAVHALRAIEQSIWEEEQSPGPGAGLEGALARRRTIRLAAEGAAGEARMLIRVDLAAVGAALLPEAYSSA